MPLQSDDDSPLGLGVANTISPTGSWNFPTPGLDMLSAQVPDARGSSAASGSSSTITESKRRQQLNEASKRCRKRHKDEGVMLASEIALLQRKVALLRSRFEAPDPPAVEENKSACYENFQLKRHVTFLDAKLKEHERWLRRIRSLLMAAPLFDFAVKHRYRRPDHQLGAPSALDLTHLDEWRKDCERDSFSRVLVTQRMNEAVRLASQNAADLLAEVEYQSSRFQRQYASRGWTTSTTSNNSLLVFRCERQLPIGSLAKDVAFKLWSSLQRDDILRTFVPVVQESTLAQKEDLCSITRRLLQHTPNGQLHVAVTAESIALTDCSRAGAEAWQISVDMLEDQYLWRLAAEAASGVASHHPPSQPAVSQAWDDGFPHGRSDSDHLGRFTIALRVSRSIGGGASVELTGCIQLVDPYSHDSTPLELLQYFVALLPVYEELHLA